MAAVQTRGSKGHWVGVGVILFIGWLFMLLGLVGVYMHRTLYNEGVFAERVTSVLQQPGVQTALATELTDAVIKEVPKAVIARPVIQSAAETVVAEPAFTNLVTKALSAFHQLLLDPATSNIVFKVEGAPQLLQQTIAPYDQQLAVQVGNAASAELAKLPNPGPAFQLIQLGADLGPVAWVVLFLGLGLLVLGALIAPVRRKGVITGCIAFGLVGIGTAIILNLIKWGLSMQTANDIVLHDAADGVFQGLFGDLLTIARVITFVGILAALVVWSLRWTAPLAGGVADKALDSGAAQTAGGRKIEVADVLSVVRAWGAKAVTPAASDWGKLLQIAVALVLGLVILFKWDLVVSIIILVLAVALLALALNRLMILILNRRAKHASAPSGD
jgi:hypothetical protein